MRPLLELALDLGKGAPPVVLVVAHWKSKVGGEDAADSWQGRQERVLARRAADILEKSGGGGAVLMTGDFNRDIGEFIPEDNPGGVLLGGRLESISGWRAFDETGPGTYYFRGSWEKIDHIFTAGACSLKSFAAVTGPWAKSQDSDLIPFRYQINTGAGYSDHLPVRGEILLAGR
jgi:endonuclease/exonuclease/phosphatase family metal-dependent hydrolase